MRLLRVTVDAFQCIEHADVALGPGLNVLYGPNDLGKSSLAAAIRNVLLLPHGSTAHEQLVSWHSGSAPRVSLTFSLEPQRIWRVTKTFGSGSAGSSYLEFSKDGVSFTADKKGRDVDGELRELLRWGLTAPGGKGGSKGLPESFLTNVLLAEQSDVPAILARGLTGDADESGRIRLNAALQALAQDPLFKRVLTEAQARSGRAFTEKGLPSRAKGSPFKDVAEELKQIQARQEELQAKLNDTAGAETRLRDLQQEHDSLSEELAQAEEALNAIRAARAQTAAREAAEAELHAAREAHAAMKAQIDAAAQATSAVETLRHELVAADAALEEQTRAVESASTACAEAERRLQEVTNESGSQARELALEKLRNARFQLAAKRDDIRSQLQAAGDAEGQLREAAQVAEELQKIAQELEQAQQEEGRRRTEAEAAQRRRERHRLVEAFARRRDAQRRLTEVESALEAAQTSRDKAAEKRGAASELERESSQRWLPERNVVDGLRTLAHDLEVGEASLGGGLSVVIEPLRDLRVQVAADGAVEEEHRSSTPLRFEPQRALSVRVDDVLRLTVTAGEAAQRSAVEQLRSRWSAEARPVLDRAGVTTIAALESLRREGDERAQRAATLQQEATALEERAALDEQRGRDREGLRNLVAQHEQVTTGHDPAGFEDEVQALGDAWEAALNRVRERAETDVTKAAGNLEAARSATSELRARHAERSAGSAPLEEAAKQARLRFPDGVGAAAEAARKALDEVESEIRENTEQSETISAQADEQTAAAQREVGTVADALKAARTDLERARRERDEKRSLVDGAAARADVLRESAAKLDMDTAARRVAEAESILSKLPVAASPATADDVAVAEGRVSGASLAAMQKWQEILKAQGALDHVGGAVVREQKDDVDRALAIVLEKEHRVGVEYAAWKLLADTLRDVENSDGIHLGKALTEPLSARFRALTGNRYGTVAIGQQLNGEGIEAAGQVRPFDALSAGTQDQLATLFRLCIAEHLCTAIVIDDHLSQCDGDKLRAFGDLLRQAGQQIQVVLLTCRPADYLLDGELPAEGEAVRDLAAGSLRAIDLARSIQRYASG